MSGLRNLGIELDAGGACSEDKRILAVVERVKQNLNRVGVTETGVAAILGDNDILRLGVETDDGYVEVAVVEADAQFCFLGREFTFVGVLLDEIGCRIKFLPERFVDESVEHGWLLEPVGPQVGKDSAFGLL